MRGALDRKLLLAYHSDPHQPSAQSSPFGRGRRCRRTQIDVVEQPLGNNNEKKNEVVAGRVGTQSIEGVLTGSTLLLAEFFPAPPPKVLTVQSHISSFIQHLLATWSHHLVLPAQTDRGSRHKESRKRHVVSSQTTASSRDLRPQAACW